MNKLKNELMFLKIQLNSSYGMGSIGTSLYDEFLKKKDKLLKINHINSNRVLKIKKILNGG
jgi:hypothetical protein